MFFYTLDQFRGTACVSIGFLADGTLGLPEYAGRKECIVFNF